MPRGRGNAISGPASWHTRGAVRMLGAGGRPRRHGKATVSRVLHGSGGSAVAWLAEGPLPTSCKDPSLSHGVGDNTDTTTHTQGQSLSLDSYFPCKSKSFFKILEPPVK